MIGDRGATLPMHAGLERGGTIEGRVLDDRGRPLPNIMVTSAARTTRVTWSRSSWWFRTNDLGEFPGFPAC